MVREQLLPQTEVKLKLSVEPRCEADLGHFGELTLAVWNRVEDLDREMIAQYWQKMETLMLPAFGLLEVWFDDPEALATTKPSGGIVVFDWRSCRFLPDEILQSVIAHELAHVFQWSLGKSLSYLTSEDVSWESQDLFKDLVGPYGLIELHADQTMAKWGFDPLDVHLWMWQNTSIVGGTIQLRPKPLLHKTARRRAQRTQFLRYHSKCAQNRFDAIKDDEVP